MATLDEVARRAGVTAATVSNVLRNRGRVGEATRARVLEAVQALGYRPHLAARALAEGRAPTVALMVSSIANPFYPEFALAVERAVRRNGQFLIVCNTNEDPLQGRAYLDQIAGTISEGILVTNANLHLPDLVDVARRGVPVVLCLWERPDAPPEGLPCVAVDFREAGRIATRHLLELGHRTIGVIVGGSASGVQAARYDGFVDVMREAGLDASIVAAGPDSDSIEGGVRAAGRLLDAHPGLTALVATNDLPAIGALHAAADRGRRVPDDLSIVGITDIHLASDTRPTLTTVAIPTAEAAGLAVELLNALREAGGRIDDASRVRIASLPRLVVRGTTAAVSGRRSAM
ncbi:bacterial regulatory s, lacI family protein [Burkholderia ambifaria AMMD]|uniref:Transcriptional regulator, LacI family n=1 Tax=Burkholderia ambifaria (strain ATCC BAA-244 / DSM 16087 / CCUG 44356 / LMG 19182 / AMMD) TaxID=339670 RepID=Q0B5U5_BURCM|nr:LacI family DNA-binding transcriptional regulator [Burkholderia ambifaria]ABI90478.1 transcriptional regulator, LacI family [Burkholderia ambifaria AMMD]AJY24333.1 bacterial regulatory s, lacI family protein [Burkholderia ambifaria AMMD]MBR7931745.1 LacI family DNA-binding transcriptional regulator [Burkholderia ambifaria]PEH68525.1 LacI family transcriptional regulator [Burkholderia ambifaria]QQC06903.1 LacI family DNA-binding transcriptional regulator [Burkholderia ambifaria]